MKVLTQIAAVATLAVCSLPAFAQQQDRQLAEQLNKEGRKLVDAQQYREASEKFRQAAARVPDPKYFNNLCATLIQQGELQQAYTACLAAGNNDPTSKHAATTQKLIARIETDAKARNIVLKPGEGRDEPNLPSEGTPPEPNPAPNTNGPGPVSSPAYTAPQPPAQNLFAGTTSDNKYTWTLGLDLFGSSGKIGSNNAFGRTAVGLRIKIDYLLSQAWRIGAQGFFQYTYFGESESQRESQTLKVMDFGLAAYKDLCVKGRLCLRPLAGAQLAFMSPDGSNDSDDSQAFDYMALGARVELGAHFAFGSQREHVLGLALGANLYTSVLSSSSMDASTINLDKGGTVAYLAIGYTYRFDTPLGTAPFVTLQ